MKRITVLSIVIFTLTIIANTYGDLLSMEQKKGFCASSRIYQPTLVEEGKFTELVFPRPADWRFVAINKDLIIQQQLYLAVRKDIGEFTGVEKGDPWWQVNYYFSTEWPGWSILNININGIWNPSKQKVDNRWLESTVVSIRFKAYVPHFYASYVNLYYDSSIDVWCLDESRRYSLQYKESQLEEKIRRGMDINNDSKVDILDLVTIAGGDKHNPRDPKNLDLNGDIKVDILDWVEKVKQNKAAKAAPPKPAKPDRPKITTWGGIRAR